MIGSISDSPSMRFTASVRDGKVSVTTTDDQTYFMRLIDAREFYRQLGGALKALEK